LPTGAIAQRIHDLSGTEPFELIRSAKAIEAADAVGRHAHDAATGESSDPIADLQRATTGSLVDRNHQQDRLQTWAKHGRVIAQMASKVATQTNGQACLTAVNRAGVCVEHSAQEQSNRKRSRFTELGEKGDCPRRQCIRWDWKGLTSAPQTCWHDAPLDNKDDLPKTLFKCRIVLKGPDVFTGLQDLMDAGLMKGPLPHYIRDAPMLGGKITVDHGAVTKSSDEK
jgi:hypothetical protein